MHRILNAPDGRALQLARDKDRDDTVKLTELYLRALSREPNEQELQIAVAHLKKKQQKSESDPAALSADQAAREAYEDIIWVVVNTKEFLFNH